jgi:hypothetical protein
MAEAQVARLGAMQTAVVRRGVVIWGAGPWDEKKRAFHPPAVKSGPGEKVSLPAKEVARLRAAGVLHDPQQPEIAMGMGPSYAIEDGKQVEKLSADAAA